MPHTNVAPVRDHTNEIRRLSTLLEISQAVAAVLNLKTALGAVLDVLHRRHHLAGGAVTLVEEETRQLTVEAASGARLPGDKARRSGDGITGRVIDSGKAM